jgi:hypothetical protein
MSCGNVHNKTACPKCGSKAVSASWYYKRRLLIWNYALIFFVLADCLS